MKKFLLLFFVGMVLGFPTVASAEEPDTISFTLDTLTTSADTLTDITPTDVERTSVVYRSLTNANHYNNSFDNGFAQMGFDTDFFKSKTNPNVKPFKFFDDFTFVGVPVFAAGIFIKSEKKSFAQQYQNTHANTRLLTHFKTKIDDYLQYFGPVMTVGLKLGGVEGRSDWPRLFASSAMSYGIMAILVNSIKYTSKEMRPDGTSRNSWPSGHTATSFTGATILHKEYGLTRSPWYSVAGYGLATATGIMRVLNNRHWVSDILSGAGIGIISAEAAYALSDILFKGKGLLRGNSNDFCDLTQNPSFFSISMGVGFDSRTFDFGTLYQDDPVKLKFQRSTVVGVEGAYFFNKYIGVGGRLRVKSSPIRGWASFMSMAENETQEVVETLQEWDNEYSAGAESTALANMISERVFTIESDHLTEFAADAGMYFNIPLSPRFAIGTKLLIGRSIMQELDIDAHFKGNVKAMSYTIEMDGNILKDFDILGFKDTGNTYEHEWDYMTVSANNSTKIGTGISLTYSYKNAFTWKVFCDYDFTKKTYTLTYNPYEYWNYGMPDMVKAMNEMGVPLEAEKYKVKKNMNTFVIGASFAVAF